MPLVVSRSEGNNILQLKMQRLSNEIQDFLRLSLCSFHYSMLHLQLSKIKICNDPECCVKFYLKFTYTVRPSLSHAGSWKANCGKYKIYTETICQEHKYITYLHEQIITFWIHTYTHKHKGIPTHATADCYYYMLMSHKFLT